MHAYKFLILKHFILNHCLFRFQILYVFALRASVLELISSINLDSMKYFQPLKSMHVEFKAYLLIKKL